MVAYLKAGPQVRTYSDYLMAAHEAKKEDSYRVAPRPQESNYWSSSQTKDY